MNPDDRQVLQDDVTEVTVDTPFITLLANDVFAADVLNYYVQLLATYHPSESVVARARDLYKTFVHWRKKHPELVVIPSEWVRIPIADLPMD